MKTLKIFLASSEELANDRNAFGNLVRRLDKIYEKRGKRIELFEWEDSDAAYNNCRKQDEYNDEVRASDMFLALFYKKAGKFTIEEFDVATEEFQRTGISPKPYVYCRDLLEGEQESEELKEFKERLFNEMGHYWCQYDNNDSLQLHFVMQLQLVENNRLDNLNVENGEIKLEDTTVAHLDNLGFAAGNPDYQRMSQRLKELPFLIEKANYRLEKFPGDNDLINDLQKLLDEKNQLQKDFEKQQQLLFDTAKRIAKLRDETITGRMRRAIEAFEKGNVHEANIILNEAEHDAKSNLDDYKQSKALTEQKRKVVVNSIEELSLKALIILSDVSIVISERIKSTRAIYSQADEMAKEINYDKKKYSNLLSDYARFLNRYGEYSDAEKVLLRQICIIEELYGTKHPNIATAYNNIGTIYQLQGEYEKSLSFLLKSLEIVKQTLGDEHPKTASSYNNIGAVYDELSNYDKALEYYSLALSIRIKNYGMVNSAIANSYNNIGMIYLKQGEYSKALDYYNKALANAEKALGNGHPYTAIVYSNIGAVYDKMNIYGKAFEYYTKALTIEEKEFGAGHPNTAAAYNNIGSVYKALKRYDEALEYHMKALKINEKTYGTKHPKTAIDYHNIGSVYQEQGDSYKALEFYFKCLAIEEKFFGSKHPSIAFSYNNIGSVYYQKGDYSDALVYFEEAFAIFNTHLGSNHPNTRVTREWMIAAKVEIQKQKSNKTFWQWLLGK